TLTFGGGVRLTPLRRPMTPTVKWLWEFLPRKIAPAPGGFFIAEISDSYRRWRRGGIGALRSQRSRDELVQRPFSAGHVPHQRHWFVRHRRARHCLFRFAERPPPPGYGLSWRLHD